jgi:hypothetical protein
LALDGHLFVAPSLPVSHPNVDSSNTGNVGVSTTVRTVAHDLYSPGSSGLSNVSIPGKVPSPPATIFSPENGMALSTVAN